MYELKVTALLFADLVIIAHDITLYFRHFW
jgi:hypothetical protein